MLQDQDIKGFTLLELLAVLAIVLIVTAVGLPNFNSWKTEREVRVGAEKIAQVLSGVNAQTKRGTFPYVQMHICLLYTSPSPRDGLLSRMPSSA